MREGYRKGRPPWYHQQQELAPTGYRRYEPLDEAA